MTTIPKPYLSGYDRRVALVQGAVKEHSKLSDKAAHEVAVHVLTALNSIPEKVR